MISKILFLSVTGLFMLTDYGKAQNNASDEKRNVARLTRYEVKPAYNTAFQKVLSDYVLQSLHSEANIMSEAYIEQDTTAVLWLMERWTDKDDLNKVAESTSYKAIQSLAANALVQPSTIIYIQDLEPLNKQQWRRLPDKKDNPLTIMLFVNAKPGTENRFKDVYHTAMPQFRSEAGVINYQLSQLENDSTQFVTYEKFRNEDAFQYHLKFPPIQPVIDYLNTSIKQQPFQAGLHRLIEFAPVK
ncbi:antibiotic biosynthesis monooxygenase [Pinibacter aurantiacus]|uniref:Antibiotic biosynthesis monooxygenase n=1 Tax=Pinibacter aurantiacus TaxID=2851599 RepID=A0A9E2S7G5_9BACT|nr:antibiotic biosynthesis monooxygenase [Pinibacter aurantiacus]MBV4355899.1 antibiotic biosynthesis monooxygenase [Pinibacter aurantiacus]